MPDLHAADDRVWVAIDVPRAFVRVAGRATFKVGGALKQFGAAALEAGCRTMALDMGACTGMDSTFMGVLAGLALRLRKEKGEMVLMHLNPRTRGLVATLGLDQIVTAYEAGGLPPERQELSERAHGLTVLEPAGETKQATARKMLEAHEYLVKVDPGNQPRFKDVLTFLREDLRQMGSRPADTRAGT